MNFDAFNIEEAGNYFEAVFWIVVAITLFCGARRSEPQIKRVGIFASLAFAVFGISDLIEAQTGAWWRPWWLLVMKATCVLIFAGCWRRYHQIKKATPSSADLPSAPSAHERARG